MFWEVTLVLRIQTHLRAHHPKFMTQNNFFIKGFTLVEIAIVLIIVGFLVAAFLAPLTAQIDQKNNSETIRLMDDSKEALMGYAVSNKHLPCPDKTSGANNGPNDNPNDGLEDFDALTGNCIVYDGNLPWATLSLPNTDSWQQPLIYHVTVSFAQRAPLNTFGLGTLGNLKVCDIANCSGITYATTAVAVLVSRGKNRGICSTLPSPPACKDERANDDGNNIFVSHVPTASGSANGEYDDLTTWVSSNVLLNRMVTSGQLP